jgi:hypothetical protein
MHTPRLTRRAALKLGAAGAFSSTMFRAVRAEAAVPTQRLAFLFHANGSHHAWTPTGNGADFVLTPHIAGLETVRNDILILRRLTLQRGAGNAHKAATLSVMGAGAPTSFDQVMAQAWKGQTALPSLELAIGYTSGGGGKAPSLSQVNGVFLPGERNPVAAYQRVTSRISGADPMTTDPLAMEKALTARRSVLDYLREETGSLKGRLGAKEKPKLDFYLDSLRDLEKSLGDYAGEVRASAACGKTMPQMDVGILDAHVGDMPKVSRLFLDTMALALACGVTRVVSMMWGGGESAENINFGGITINDWHITTHANPAGPKGDAITKMQGYLSGEYAYFVQRLKAFSDGAGTLYDNTLAIWGTQNGNTNQTNFAKEDHDRHNTPFILAGRGGGKFKPGRVMDCGDVNHNDLYLAIAQAYGVDLKTVGDPTWCKAPLSGVVG